MLTNDDLARMVDTSDSWIAERTGIRERRIAAEGELTSSMGACAARAALDDAGLAPEDVDLIVLATSTPDQTFPATAVTIQAELGITHGAAFDVQAVCSGFVFALATADNYLKSGQFKRALVIGSEAFSRILDWQDRCTCVLFGDGAGALVVEAQMQKAVLTDRGVLATHLRSDGRYRDKLYVDGGRPRPAPSAVCAWTAGGLPPRRDQDQRGDRGDLDKGIRLSGLGYRLVRAPPGQQAHPGRGSPKTPAWRPHHRYRGQACQYSAASIPLALTQGADGRIKTGDLVLLEAMGGGFTWGAVLLRWCLSDNCRAKATPLEKVSQNQEFDCRID